MSAFVDLLKKDGIGHVWLVEVSNDDFATVAHRWSDKAVSVGGHTFDPRIIMMSKLSKALGLDSFPTASTLSMSLNNEAFDLDWLVDVDGGPIEFTYRFRVSLGLYDPRDVTSNPAYGNDPVTQVMGSFGILDAPTRTNTTVEISLADDLMGLFNDLASSPTVNEWIADAGSTVNNCILKSSPNALAPLISFDTPLPLAFGPTTLGMLASLSSSFDNGGTLCAAGYTHAIIVCATTSADAVTANDVQRLDATYRPDAILGANGNPWMGAGQSFTIPKTVTVSNDPLGVPDGTYNIWSPQKSQGITKDGHTWTILWIAFAQFAYEDWAVRNLGYFDGGQQTGHNDDGSPTYAPVGSAVPAAPTGDPANPFNNNSLAAIASFFVTGYPLSAQTVKTSPYQTGLNVLQDLLSYYSHGSAANVDTASFARAAAQNTCLVQGVLQPLQPQSSLSPKAKYLSPIAAAITPGVLRQAIGDIARSIGVDVFFSWAGLFSVSAGWFDFGTLTSTPIVIEEERMQTVKERKPSQGERWTFYNRIYVQGPDGVVRGPYDNPASIADVGVTLARTIVGKWLMSDNSGGDYANVAGLWQLSPRLEARQRNLLSFQTDREALQLDLGSFFSATWTRGNRSQVYGGALFHVEQISVDFAALAVEIEGVWADETASENVQPYLLDDESLTVRVASGGGRTALVTDATSEVDFSSGDLVADGVHVGDILLLLDGTQAAGVFSRRRALLIAAVDPAGSALFVSDPDLNFAAPSGFAVTTWAIYRGKTTYPTAGTDPTHYPSGSLMYGKVTNAAGVFSDSSAGNQLLDG